jgi:WD40 repeat protein/transcriptional regulator with XRE-family HTH domain
MAEQAVLSFGGLLRQLRAEAGLTQEELAEAAGLSPRSVSDLERGVNRTARKDTALLLAGALGLAGPARELFVAAARGRGPAEDVLAAREGRAPGPGHRVAQWAPACPYRGLLPFGESDAEVFYGRERLSAGLAAKLAGQASRGGLVVVTGASGSGKSSLLRAGLLPILARGQQVPGSDRWPRIVMTPTKDPLTELAARLAAVGGPDALAVRDGLARHPDQAHLAIWSAVLAAAAGRDEGPPASGDGAARLVLIVDQFEQVFTLSPDRGGEGTGRAFITALCAAAANPAGPGQVPPALVVIAVRGDFCDRCAAVPELAGALQDGLFVVVPMTESELRVAITGPAEAAGLRIDPGLTETILGDLQVAGGDRSAGVLPLLSQAMALTWEQREGDRLTSRGYAQAGGVSHAVQTGADRAYGTLPAGQQAIAREVLRSMTVASRDGGLARRPVTRQDLYAGLPGAARSGIDAVLDAFAAERLAVLDGDTAQLSHDVLLRAWPRLRGWLEEDQASWILHGQLADAAAAWHDSGDDPSFLYRGAQLATLRQAVTRWSADPARSPALTGTQRGFLQASERAAARSTRWRRSALALLALLTVLAGVTAGFAFSQRATAIRQRDQTIYNQVVAEALQYGTSDTSLAAQLNLAAYRIQPAPDAASRLLNTENTPLSSPLAAGTADVNSMGFSTSVAFSPDGHTLASASGYDGTIRLWDVADPAHPRPLGQPRATDGSVGSVAFSPNGHMLATGGGNPVQLWNVADPARSSPLGQPLADSEGSNLSSVAFSPYGHTLATGGSNEGTIRLWNVADPAHPTPLGQPLATDGGVGSAAFSPDGHTLAAGDGDGTIRLWDLTDPAHPRLLGRSPVGGAAAVSLVAFSGDGHTLATVDVAGAIRLWDLTDLARPRPFGQPLPGDTADISSVAFSPKGHTLATGSAEGTIQLWDLTDLAHPRLLGQPVAGSTAVISSVAFSPDGHTLASGSVGGTVRLWSLPRTLLADDTAAVSSVAFSSDGHTLATIDGGDTIRLWDLTDPAHPRLLGRSLTGGTPAVPSVVAFSGDGHTLTTISAGGTIRLWNLIDPAHPRPLGHTQAGDTSLISWAFSGDGHTLATIDGVGTIRLWNLIDPAHPHLLGRPLANSTADIASVALSSDGHTLATIDGGGMIRLWDFTDSAHPRPLGQPLATDGSAGLVAFSPDGHTLASASSGYDGTIQLWDFTDPAHPSPVGQPLADGTAVISSVAFSPDGHTLAIGGDDGTIRLWNLNVQYAIQRICATAGGLTPRQWSQYIPQLRYQPSCAH